MFRFDSQYVKLNENLIKNKYSKTGFDYHSYAFQNLLSFEDILRSLKVVLLLFTKYACIFLETLKRKTKRIVYFLMHN